MNHNTEFEILQDVNKKTNKKIDWRGRKLTSMRFAESYHRLGNERKAERARDCGTFLGFKVEEDGGLKLAKANFCKIRLCPMCAWRRSLKIYGQVSQVMNALVAENNYDFLFLTLTVKNVIADDLGNEITRLMESFKKLVRKKQFKKSVKGFFRGLEVTYNRKDNTFHPHFHCILAVNKAYFTHSEYYIKQADWVDLWQQALRVDYKPSVDIRKIKPGGNIAHAVAESAKYTVKVDDYITDNDKLTDYLVGVLDGALANRRLVSFGGVFRDMHKKLNLDDSVDGDLINTDGADELRADVATVIVYYRWGLGDTGLYNYYYFGSEGENNGIK